MNIKKIKKAQKKVPPIPIPAEPVMPPQQIAKDIEDVTGLTDAELERNDYIHNEIFDLINRLNPAGTELEWDISIIAEVADDIEDYLVAKGICTAKEFSPYREI